MKRFTCKFLAALLLVMSMDLSWLHLDVLAEDIVTDVFVAESKLQEFILDNSNPTTINERLSKLPDFDTSTTETKENVFDRYDAGNEGKGVIVFNQTDIKGATQIKSGNWLNDTEFEAMSGTPTTEPLFVTMGGTQWLVDMQYRLVSAPYVRKYHLEASAPNYRYYKLGPVASGSEKETSYIAQGDCEYNWDPGQYLTMAPDEPQNYAFKYHSDGSVSKSHDYLISFTGDKHSANSPKNTTFGVEGVECAPGYGVDGGTAGKTFKATKAFEGSSKIADVTIAVDNEYSGSNTVSVDPSVAQAILFKQQVRDVIEQLKAAWKEQDDNYRADQGVWDEHKWDYPLADHLSFMYTYGGMVRHTSAKGRVKGTNNTPNCEPTYNNYNGVNAGDTFWNPYIISYLYDWDNYNDTGNVDSTYGSDVVRYTTAGQWRSKSQIISDLLCLGMQYSAGDVTKLNGYFDVGSRNAFYDTRDVSTLHGTNYWNESSVNWLNADLELFSIMVQYSGENALIALTNPEDLYAFSAAPKTNKVGLGENGVHVNRTLAYNSDSGSTYNFKDEGAVELGYLYYRALYSLFLNYSGLFYHDEVDELFSGLPGFKTNSKTDVTTYNTAVNCNLAAVFGRCNAPDYELTTFIPFAVFPNGGYLDSSVAGSVRGTANLTTDALHANDLMEVIYSDDQLVYGINVIIRTKADEGNYTTAEAKQFQKKIHNYEKNVPHHISGGTNCCYGNDIKCPKSGHADCGKTHKTATEIYCSGSSGNTHKVDCTACGGDGNSTDAVACPASVHKATGCTNCGGDGYATDAVTCTDCNGTGDVDCSTCGGDNVRTCPVSGETCDNHQWQVENGSTPTNKNGTAYYKNHIYRTYKNEYHVTASYSINKHYGGWVESPKNMSYNDVFGQKFENVEWLDLLEYKLWTLDKGNLKDTTALLMHPITATDLRNASKLENEIIVTKAVDKLGYHVYNLDDNDSEMVWPVNQISRDLQQRGRVANSWNRGSLGNELQGEGECLLVNTYGDWDTYGGGSGKKRLTLVSYKRSDTPFLNTGTTSSYSNFVNNDYAAFQFKDVDDGTDDVHLIYKPLQQGGREDCSFYGFVNQALAYTFMWANVNKETYYSRGNNANYLHSYCNSLIVQGDYLTVDRYDTKDLALMGMYYDTWQEATDFRLHDNKFALLPESALLALNPYYSTCKWVPARLSYLSARAGHEQIYGWGSPISSEDNNWVIHTYCGGINGAEHVCWDSVDASVEIPTCREGKRCTWPEGGGTSPAHFAVSGELTDKGTVTAVTPDKVVHISEHYASTMVDSNTHGKIVKLDNTWKSKTNDTNVANDPNGIGANMPYVGYGTPKTVYNGTTEITLANGYEPGYKSNFEREDSFINPDAPKGFKTFGIEQHAVERTVNKVINGNCHTTKVKQDDGSTVTVEDGISSYYPWLSELNVHRVLDNNIYQTGIAYNTYICTSDYEDMDASKDHYYTNEPTTTPKVYAAYDTDTKDGRPNEVVIYNPLATQSSTVLPLSKYLTDASNKGDSSKGNSRERYLKSYGGDSEAYSLLRDTRVAERIDLENLNTEQYLTGSGVHKQTEKVVTSTHYELREESQISTTAYTMSDYNVQSSLDVSEAKFSSNGSFVAEYNDRYIVGLGGFAGSNNAGFISMNLQKGDTIEFSDSQSIVLKPNYKYELPFKNFAVAYNEYLKATNQPEIQIDATSILKLKAGMKVMVGADNFTLRKGTVFNLALPITNYTGLPSQGVLELTEINGVEYSASNSQFNVKKNVSLNSAGDRYTYNYRVEVLSDTALNSLSFTVGADCELPSFDNALSFESIPLLNYVPNATNGWVCSDTFSYRGGSRSESWWYNKYLVIEYNCSVEYDYSSWEEHMFAVFRARGNSSVALNNDSLNDPHKVPNTCWKYYVLGWETTSGQKITSVDSTIFNNMNTLLKLPGGAVDDKYLTGMDNTLKDVLRSGIISVGYLSQLVREGRVYVYKGLNGSYGLTLNCPAWANDPNNPDIASFRRSLFTGYSAEHYALIQFAETGLNTLDKDVTLNIVHAEKGDDTTYTKNCYECLFKATLTEGIAYSVKRSMNTQHRIKLHYVGFEKDWEEVQDVRVAFEGEAYKEIYGDYLSLDDEFTVYWDNHTDLVPSGDGTATNIAQPSPVLGRGWDNKKHCYVNAHNAGSRDVVKQSTYWQTYMNGSDKSITDTTKWIREKYIVFNIDMYGFTTGNSIVATGIQGEFDPTTPAYNVETGEPNNIVYIPAGTKVHLGVYEITTDDKGADDKGRFTDYGYNNGGTNSPCGNYTYHFWCPLSDGELSQTAHAQFVVVGINQEQTSPADGDGPKIFKEGEDYSPVAIQRAPGLQDEWGDPVLTATSVQVLNNVDVINSFSVDTDQLVVEPHLTNTTFARYHDSVNSTKLSVVGRIGGLTVVDTGDPRYQDTFKNAAVTKEFAIAPIVRRIASYSNIWKVTSEGKVAAEHGSQMRYLTDSTDVRGRRFINDGVPSEYHFEDNGNTYGSTYFKQDMTMLYKILRNWDIAESEANLLESGLLYSLLPMTPEFNVHKELRETNTVSKLGYELYCTLETTGSYFGSSGPRDSDNEKNVNSNNDYGQTKVQVHPMYIALNVNSGEVMPVDVYMRKNGNYRLVNAGSMWASEDELSTYNAKNGTNIKDAGPYYLDDAYDATHTSSITTNSEVVRLNGRYSLSQEMLRRSVSVEENIRTFNVVENDTGNAIIDDAIDRRVTTTLLKPNSYGSVDNGIGGEGLDYSYVYGNAQILFLREYNRTFVGGASEALNQKIVGTSGFAYTSVVKHAARYGQKWHFGIGLPASSVFIEHGKKITERDILTAEDGWYILCVIDAYSIGEKWVLRYQSSLSMKPITIGGKTWESDEWNVYNRTLKYLVPVAIYMPGQTSASDKDTYGTH